MMMMMVLNNVHIQLNGEYNTINSISLLHQEKDSAKKRHLFVPKRNMNDKIIMLWRLFLQTNDH